MLHTAARIIPSTMLHKSMLAPNANALSQSAQRASVAFRSESVTEISG